MSQMLNLAVRAHIDPASQAPRRIRVSALRRVPEHGKLRPPKVCRYCGGTVQFTDHERVYGRTHSNWPYLYRCTGCDARIGVHPYTHYPLGTLADAALRRARRVNKDIFNLLWRGPHAIMPSRQETYAWLAEAMGITREQCHWGLFEIDQCERAGALSRMRLESAGKDVGRMLRRRGAANAI